MIVIPENDICFFFFSVLDGYFFLVSVVLSGSEKNLLAVSCWGWNILGFCHIWPLGFLKSVCFKALKADT